MGTSMFQVIGYGVPQSNQQTTKIDCKRWFTNPIQLVLWRKQQLGLQPVSLLLLKRGSCFSNASKRMAPSQSCLHSPILTPFPL